MVATQFATLARVILTLALGRPITLPFIAGARGQEWSETFLVGDAPGGHGLLHGLTSRRGGVVSQLDSQPCDWCLGTMLKEISGWDASTIAAIETQLVPLAAATPTVSAIIDLGERPGASVVLAGRRWQRMGGAIDTDSDGAWSLDEAVAAVAHGR